MKKETTKQDEREYSEWYLILRYMLEKRPPDLLVVVALAAGAITYFLGHYVSSRQTASAIQEAHAQTQAAIEEVKAIRDEMLGEGHSKALAEFREESLASLREELSAAGKEVRRAELVKLRLDLPRNSGGSQARVLPPGTRLVYHRWDCGDESSSQILNKWLKENEDSVVIYDIVNAWSGFCVLYSPR